MFQNRKAFTLIELLVVIAVIGILSTLLIVALTTARDKAKDARIKSALSQIRNKAESIYVDSGGSSYEDLISSEDYTVLGDDISRQGGVVNMTIASDGKTYAVESKLNSEGYWCIDYSGQSIAGRATDTGCIAD